MKHLRIVFLGGSFSGLVIALGGAFLSAWDFSAVLLLTITCLSLGAAFIRPLKGLQYTFWILTAVIAGLTFPSLCLGGGVVDLRNKWIILFVVQGVMFGMGTQMRIRDFIGILQNPRGVLVGLLCQFTIMPLVGFGLAMGFDFSPEIGAGIILIGSCSSGLASNVMTYLAKANLALSVTVTACATLMAPLMTPLLMKLLAGTLIEIKFAAMMVQIIKIVVVPISAALLHDYLQNCSPAGRRGMRFIATGASLYLVFLLGGWTWLAEHISNASLLQVIVLLNFLAGAVVLGWLYHLAVTRLKGLATAMPYLSMFGIIYFTTVTTAAGRDSLLTVGLLLLFAAFLHNSAGYGLGYLFSRLLGLDRQSARAMALEVGLQNGGMASGIAGSMGMLGTLGLASAVFSPWMNVSGSLLANYWKSKQPTKTE